jgi:hypothetical protein
MKRSADVLDRRKPRDTIRTDFFIALKRKKMIRNAG